MRFLGETAALGTAVCWAGGSNLFAAAGRRIGAVRLNRLRITMAFAFLALALLVARGAAWPTWATTGQLGLLALSGLVGFVFGDTWYFRSLVILGPGRASLLAATAPIFTAVLAWPLLGEVPLPLAALGMLLVLGGVFWVLREHELRHRTAVAGSAAAGVVAGVLGAVGQGGGFVLSKMALRTGLDALSATVIRIAAAAVAIWVLAAIERQVVETISALRDRRGAAFTVAGAVMGPCLGVTLSLIAVSLIEAGVAAALTAVAPVLTLLIASRFHREPLTARIFLGTVVAVVGVIVLFLR